MSVLPLRVCGRELLLDPAGALLWPDEKMLIVADLHIGKAAALARRGLMAPPYEFEETLARLEALIERHRPRMVVSLGDGLHGAEAAALIEEAGFDRLSALIRRQLWLWVTGNHDTAIPLALGGAVLPRFERAGLSFVHVPSGREGEIAGHLHPVARIATPAHRIQRRRCFASDGRRLLLPALGAFTGGLDVLDPAIAGLFPGPFTAYLLGSRRVFAVPAARLTPEPDARRHLLSCRRSSRRPAA